MTRSEALKRAQKKYYLKKKDQIFNQQKQYKKKNKKKTNETQKKYRSENVEKIREIVRKSYQKNKIKKKIYTKIYSQKRRKTDPVFRLMGNIRTRFYLFLNSKKIHKKNKTFDLVGCTPKELKEYIEKKFLPGMSWDNYQLNTWNIDHIKPLSLAKNIDDIIRLKLMHYTNLQPLWALDNLRKSNKYE